MFTARDGSDCGVPGWADSFSSKRSKFAKLLSSKWLSLDIKSFRAWLADSRESETVVKLVGNVSAELVDTRSFSTFFGGFFRCWKKSFLSTYGFIKPVPRGSNSVKTSIWGLMACISSSSFLTGVFLGELAASLSLKRLSASLSNHCMEL